MESKSTRCVAAVNDQEDKAQAKKLQKYDAKKYKPRLNKKLLKMFPDHIRRNHHAMGNAHAAATFGPLMNENSVAMQVSIPSERQRVHQQPPDLSAKDEVWTANYNTTETASDEASDTSRRSHCRALEQSN
ncbi:hypothetical protein ST47_g8334 [Ascochyta rabiei]|uniref:Uncharacterized protein n=2 Tax=Didymella rabiei TaxID=5454 RepID=A0A162ZC76_DIDRA|nr:hypothetical protein ST47_g8334 [Ascochyta rabiei]